MQEMENKFSEKISDLGILDTGGQEDASLQQVVAKMQSEFNRKFKRFTQIDA